MVNACGSPIWKALGTCQAEWRLCRPLQAWGAWPSRAEIVQCLWVAGLEGLRFMTQQKSCQPVQVRGAQPSGGHECLWITSLAGLRGTAHRVEILQACAGLRGAGPVKWRSWNLWITGLVGLRDMPQWRACGSEGWVWGSMDLPGLKSGPKDQRSDGPWNSCSEGLWGRAWHAALAAF
jgi:hypothetical protein